MAVLNLALPPLARVAAEPILAQGPLARWCARADRQPNAPPGRAVWIRELFQFTGTTLPVAALTRQLDVGDAQGSSWMRADPAHLRADLSTARMLACGELGLSIQECQQLLLPLKPLFGDAGFPIDAPTPSRWYLRAPMGAKLPDFAVPETVLGDDLKRHLPDVSQARRWSSLLNEAQIILHNHPVNAARIERGSVPVNGLWFWGAGTLPEWVRSGVNRIQSPDVLIAALAAQAQIAVVASDPVEFKPSNNGLLDLDNINGLASLARDWLPAIDAMLKHRQLQCVRLLFASGERFQVRPSQRWRFWRRQTALSG